MVVDTRDAGPIIYWEYWPMLTDDEARTNATVSVRAAGRAYANPLATIKMINATRAEIMQAGARLHELVLLREGRL